MACNCNEVYGNENETDGVGQIKITDLYTRTIRNQISK
jgi:hypothetical protein